MIEDNIERLQEIQSHLGQKILWNHIKNDNQIKTMEKLLWKSFAVGTLLTILVAIKIFK
jgi:hypothetical protein